MLSVIDNGLPRSKSPVSNTVRVNGQIYTVQIPRDPETGLPSGDGDIATQTHRVLSQLRTTMSAAGGDMNGVAQISVYIVNAADAPGMNQVYREYFSEPYPNRATMVVKELLGENQLIEIVVQAHVDVPAGKSQPGAR